MTEKPNEAERYNSLVDAALAVRAGRNPGRWWRGEPNKGTGHYFEVLTFALIVDGAGRRPVAFLEANAPLFQTMNPKGYPHARNVLATLEAWCRARGLPPLMAAVSPAYASLFVSDLARTKGSKTVRNYLGVLRKVWECARDNDTRHVASTNNWRHWRGGVGPMLNPWDALGALPPPSAARKPKQKRPSLAAGRANSLVNLKKGPAEARRQADRTASELRWLVAQLRRQGMGAYAIARELRQRGYSTPRGKAWTTTGASRLLVRLARNKPTSSSPD